MKIMIYEGPKKLKVSECSDLPIGNTQIRAKTICSAISHGTEMNVYRGSAPFFKRVMQNGIFVDADELPESWTFPMRSCDPGVWFMGYSAVGEVIEVGSDVSKVKVGDIVYAGTPHQSQIIANEWEVMVIPPEISPEKAVVFTNLQTTYNGILDTDIRLGDTVVVSGLGVLGQLIVQMAKLSGALKVIAVDVCEKRLETALKNGADFGFNPTKYDDVAMEVRKVTNFKGADVVIEVSGNQSALQNAMRMAGYDTTVTCIGWYQGSCAALDLSEEFHHNRITLRCSQTGGINPSIRHMWDNERKNAACIEILKKLDIDSLITHRIPYDDAAKAYETVDLHPEEVIQVLLTY